MKVFYLLMVSLICCCANEKPKQNSVNNILIDSLFSDEFQKKYMQDEVSSLIEKLKETAGKNVVDGFYRFALSNKQYGDLVINALFDLHPEMISEWLRKNQSSFSVEQWESISSNYEIKGYKWNDSILTNTIINNAIATNNIDIKRFLLVSIAKVGTFNDVEKIKKIISKEIDINCRSEIFNAICRYSTKDNNLFLQNALEKYSEPDVINMWLQYGLQEYSRYDFLGILYNFKNRLQAEKNITRIASAKETLEILKTVIPNLEQKKEENAPIGLPLDWPKSSSLNK